MPKTILISGASKGIGLAVATALHEAGHTVIGTSRNPVQAGTFPFKLLPLNVGDETSVKACVEQALAELGHIDVQINNAGYDLYAAAEEAGVAETVAQMDVNFFGAVRMITAVLPHLRQRGLGQIINISSIGGALGLPYNSAYAASKFALEGYSESLRLELLPLGIYVSLIAPEAVATDTLQTSIRGVAQAHPAYAGRSRLLMEQMRDLGSNSPVTPQHVAGTVVQVVEAKRPKLRYPVGRQAQFIPWLKTLLPQNWFEKMMLRQFMKAK